MKPLAILFAFAIAVKAAAYSLIWTDTNSVPVQFFVFEHAGTTTTLLGTTTNKVFELPTAYGPRVFSVMAVDNAMNRAMSPFLTNYFVSPPSSLRLTLQSSGAVTGQWANVMAVELPLPDTNSFYRIEVKR